ncbi:12953_t:CDS:1, partial [Ambispora leptoticha]
SSGLDSHLRSSILLRFGHHYTGKVAEDVKKYVESATGEAAQKER